MDVGHSGAGPSLSSSPKGAYTITRSNSDGSTILLWRQHVERLAQLMLLLAEAMPSKFPDPLPLSPHLKHLIFPSLQILGAGLCRAPELRKPAEEICISILAYRNEEFESHSKKRLGCEWEIGVHLSRYLPRPFSTAVDTAIMGPKSRACNSKERCSHRKQQQGFEVAESRDCNSEERSDHIKQLEGIEVADSKDCHNYKERRESRNQSVTQRIQSLVIEKATLESLQIDDILSV
ncbi:unnamed protein product [Sphagnum jensenii]|uniref:Uncharacterized protein n=1 Tax=Sphagnum jensenii TaxID=128206 RepID=A0ABP1B578_9BRYO